MAKLYLKFGERVLKEIALSSGVVTIGRLPDNLLHLDNPGVSGHHARVYWENERYLVEDINSTNGTYVNDQPVRKAELRDGDVIGIGKHSIEFRAQGEAERQGAGAAVDRTAHWQKQLDEKPLPKLDPTTQMNIEQAQKFVTARLESPRAVQAAPPKRERVGVLTVIQGKADAQRYTLSSKMSIIGKSAVASIRLRGWFAPETAAVVDRQGDGFFIAPADQSVVIRVNDAVISEPRELREGDTLEVAGLKMSFGYES
jgi:predicted component of type VI protein secretion system